MFEATRTIAIGALFVPGARTETTDRAVAEAMLRDGSFVATGFPGAQGLEGRIGDLLGFFSADAAAKDACAIRKYRPGHNNIYRGFYPLPDEPHWSHNEIFDIGPEPPMTSPDVPGAESFREANVWPDRNVLPGWREAMLDLFALKRGVGMAVMASLARGLGLEAERLVAPSRGRNGTLRLLHYAPAPDGFELAGYPGREPDTIEDGRTLLARTHVDTGLLSLLWQDATGGLQMQGADGVWREVPAAGNGLSVHGGDLIAALTDGRIVGTTHRAVGNQGDRCSVGFFLEPDFETPVVAPTGGAPVSYAQHLVNEFPERFLAKAVA